MSGRHPVEWCPHCRSKQRSTWKGTGLYCDTKDHFIRSKKAAKRTAPASRDMYKVVCTHISDTFNKRGVYTWDELITWCDRAGFKGLKSLCEEMKQYG